MEKRLEAQINDIVGGRLSDEKMAELVALYDAVCRDADQNFFRELTYEMTGNVKDLATLVVKFRRELESKINPDLTDLATKYIPQATDQLEGIIETLEMAANNLMDNLEAMEANTDKLTETVAGLKAGKIRVPRDDKGTMEVSIDEATTKMLKPLSYFIESTIQKGRGLISDSFVQMSFQDLTGQRIKRIMELVRQMEMRLKDMIVSFGVKLSEHDKDPGMSREELELAVEKKAAELAGPQKTGEGLEQSAIDDLLANL